VWSLNDLLQIFSAAQPGLHDPQLSHTNAASYAWAVYEHTPSKFSQIIQQIYISHVLLMEAFLWGWIFRSDLFKTRFQTYFGGGNPNVINFHHQSRFEIWNWSK
jgi:hypothetical protein